MTGDWVDINLTNLEADSVMVNVSEGSLFFNSLTLSSSSSVLTGGGDVVVQSAQEFNVAWSDHTNYYCLGVPSSGSLTSTSGPTSCYDSSSNSANSGSTSCSATYRVCPSSTCTGGGPTITVQATHGSIYANGITST